MRSAVGRPSVASVSVAVRDLPLTSSTSREREVCVRATKKRVLVENRIRRLTSRKGAGAYKKKRKSSQRDSRAVFTSPYRVVHDDARLPRGLLYDSDSSQITAAEPSASATMSVIKVPAPMKAATALKKARSEGLTLVPAANASGFKHVRHFLDAKSTGNGFQGVGKLPFRAHHRSHNPYTIEHLGYFQTAAEAALEVARRLGPEASAVEAAAATAAGVKLEIEDSSARGTQRSPAPPLTRVQSENTEKKSKNRKKSGRPAQRRARRQRESGTGDDDNDDDYTAQERADAASVTTE